MGKEIIKIENQKEKARDFLKKSKEFLRLGKYYKNKKKWDLSVKNSISSIELSLKLIMVLVLGRYPKTHNFQDVISIDLMKKLRYKINRVHGSLSEVPIERLFFIPHFWANSYTYTIYGGEFGDSNEVYTGKEASLAIGHAEEILFYAEKGFFQDMVIDGNWENWISKIIEVKKGKNRAVFKISKEEHKKNLNIMDDLFKN